MPWADYLVGKKNPVYKSVDAVENVLPGTAISFYKGPKGLELWNILAGNVKDAEALLDSTLEAEYGAEAPRGWDLGQKLFWLVLSILAFPLPPFVEQMTQEGLVRDGEALPWSDIQHLVDRGTINLPMDGGAVRLASLLATCDDTRKIYTLENAFSTFGSRLVSYAYDRHINHGVELGFSTEFIVAALGLLPLAEAANNNSLKHIAKILIEGLTLSAIGQEMPDVEADLNGFVRNKLI
ncbi:hypothetical protein WS95_23475 [Burkholderia sp. MSMB1826]|nr:hypothetical protein WS95_23475 [Burkholderia sp. MSMB1826]